MNHESGIMNEENSELNLEPVEIHPEFYEKNIFGEKGQTLSTDSQGLTLGKETLKSRPEFNIFALTDAIGARNKREAWVLYQRALASGMVAEEVFYKLVWQFKTLLLASRTKSAEEADMKTFPYGKAKGFLKNFKPGEIEKFSESLVIGYHQARRGEGGIETLVEKTLLKL